MFGQFFETLHTASVSGTAIGTSMPKVSDQLVLHLASIAKLSSTRRHKRPPFYHSELKMTIGIDVSPTNTLCRFFIAIASCTCSRL
jgi:hypothetical protein